ncbi:Di-copper centre-containing protein [Lentithecium fluviatile CBS 122367]|uniref:tyrosinase n=1 Tax=Lentithecium fluviatile CBS 122367 TaxID=1168545 RepID=A0A6G1JJB9_9PLEO|nr:Di-copper centre-containing protein [Lentithecium fluviatile CBS 122367]
MKSFFSTFATLTTSLSLVGFSQAAPLSDGPSCAATQRTDESTFFSVVGVQGTGVQPRLELRELEKDTEMWNIFLQAFARFQAMDQSDKVSYFQVAGIHGAPFGPWDGVEGNGTAGYCPHLSNLFGTWHRPYLALFEQILHDRAVEIANEYPEGQARDNALKIAHKVRLPYWDWALDPTDDQGVMPASLRRTSVNVTLSDGTASVIPNPLYQFNFHPLRYDDFSILEEFQFKNWNTTIRLPEDGFAENATSRNDEANARITNQQANNRDTLYKLLTAYQPYNQWSTKANGGTIGNMETLHDGFHNVFGLGNMGIPEVSAFDPVFWFHHCQMDRIIALYQQRYPDTWVEDATQPKKTYTITVNSTQGPASPLKPFHMNANGDMWTSTTSRNWTSFGYTYPELASNPTNDTLTLTINKLYKPQTQGLNNNNTISTLGTNNRSADATDWLAEVNMPSDIQVSYSVRAFLGAPNSDPTKWATDPNYVGQIASLSSPRMASDVIVTANIGLTAKLAEKYQAGELPSLEKDDVAEWLKTNFYWRIQAMDFSEIPRNNPPQGLNVTVFSVPVHLPHNDTQVPEWTGAFQYKPEIHGNPPTYDEGSLSNTTTSGPGFNETTGGWNTTSGEWSWNITDAEAEAGAGVEESASVTPSPVSLTLSLAKSETATVVTSAATSDAEVTPAPSAEAPVEVVTLSNGQVSTRYVTEVVRVTVTAGVSVPTGA